MLEELPGEVDVEGTDVDGCDAEAGVGSELKSALGPRGGAFPDMRGREKCVSPPLLTTTSRASGSVEGQTGSTSTNKLLPSLTSPLS